MSLPTPLRASRVLERLGASVFARDLRILGVVGSTSDLLLEQARRGAPHGTVIVAERQRAGRGRRGTRWVSPARRGIWMSVLLLPAPDGAARSLLSSMVGLAVARAIESVGVVARLKWPNDVLVQDRKVAGILVDVTQAGGGAPTAVVGIGINANLGRDDLPADAPIPAGSLALLLGHDVDREALLAQTLLRLEEVLSAWTPGAAEEALLLEYRERDALKGRWVVAREGDRVVEGHVEQADPRTGLVIRTGDGLERRLSPEHTHVLRFGPLP